MPKQINSILKKINIYDMLIVLLIVGVVSTNYIWLKLDQYPIEGHDLLGVFPAVQVYRKLSGLPNYHELFDHIFGRYYGSLLGYTPLSFLVLACYYFLFGLQGQMTVMVNSLYIAVTLWCIYLIGKNAFNRGTGLLAAFILSSFPGFIAFSRVYWIEFGLMAYVTLSFYLLLKTDFFENRKYSIFLGISLALSFLHKPEFIPFVIGPLLLVAYKSGALRDIFKVKWSKKAVNFILVFALPLFLTSFWWVRYGKETFGRIFSVFSSPVEIDLNEKTSYLQNILSYESLNYYLQNIKFLIGVVFLGLLFLSLIFILIRIIIRKENRFYAFCFTIWFIVPYILLSLTYYRVRSAPHILSLLPSIAILISLGIYFIKNKIINITLAGLIILNSLNLHVISFYPVKILDYFNNFFPRVKYDWLITSSPPRQEKIELAIKEALEIIKSCNYKKEQPMVLAVFKRQALKNCIFHYYCIIGNYPFSFFSVHFRIAKELSECDFIVIEVQQGEKIAQILSREYYFPELERANCKRMFQDGIGGFELIRIVKIQGGDASLYIYKRKI